METPKIYSQNGEQIVIERLLNEAGVKTGRLLDIGAYVPDTFSNSRALIDKGWSAVLVEPSPKPFAALLDHYGSNPNVKLINTALSYAGGWQEFYDSGGDAVSSTNQAHVEKWEKGSEIRFKKFDLVSVSVKELIYHVGYQFEFINIDVEGRNLDVFRHLPWRSLESVMKVLCVEHDCEVTAMLEIAHQFGFHLEDENAENIILAKDHV